MITVKPEVQDVNLLFSEYSLNPCDRTLSSIAEAGDALVCHYARIYGAGCAFDDACQSGRLGLLKAVKSFDPASGTLFSTWASCCIIGEIRHFVRGEMGNTGLLPIEEIENTAQKPDSRTEPMRSFHLAVEDRIAIEQALKMLSELQQKVVNALFYRGLTQEQTARELGLTQRKVSRVKTKSLVSLAALLEEPNFRLTGNENSFRKI